MSGCSMCSDRYRGCSPTVPLALPPKAFRVRTVGCSRVAEGHRRSRRDEGAPLNCPPSGLTLTRRGRASSSWLQPSGSRSWWRSRARKPRDFPAKTEHRCGARFSHSQPPSHPSRELGVRAGFLLTPHPHPVRHLITHFVVNEMSNWVGVGSNQKSKNKEGMDGMVVERKEVVGLGVHRWVCEWVALVVGGGGGVRCAWLRFKAAGVVVGVVA
ncbi:hypothetical protein DFR75_103416 [Nocardia ignorata]|uniref:Uncharacterized protein n=1 Tax=Nocardia ignorata TaxID=145285 RepID=A0A4R6PPE8_NOCIG|nr:hypothetical protein DFR75_103416 [Nocardia ignorata]